MLLHAYLEDSASIRPSQTAVKIGTRIISYGDLNVMANKIANFILSRGKGSVARIGLYMPKSIETVAAIYGVLKTGAAYVPIDTDSPIERAGYIMANCEIDLVVVDRIRYEKLCKYAEVYPQRMLILALTEGKEILSEAPEGMEVISRTRVELESGANPDRKINDQEALAFILYTSGSTGLPKGVKLTHRNASVFVEWAVGEMHLNEKDVFSSHAPFHFDLSVLDLYGCAKVGGILCLIPPGLSYFPDALVDFVEKNRISVWYSVPSALKLMLKRPYLNRKLQTLKNVIYAGEVFPYEYLNLLKSVLNECDIYNFYGPTETNVITYYKLNRYTDLTDNAPIGHSCPYANILIVNEQLNPVQQGETGELIVNSDSMMCGYWKDAAKTGERIRNVKLNGKIKRYYFTGDYVYENEDGEIIYINRRDNMVKTRGFRVELGEIESTLMKKKDVDIAVVLAVNDDEIGKRLYAFITAKDGKKINVEEVLNHCSKSLPTYMIPTEIYINRCMPLTSTGKINKTKLKKELSTKLEAQRDTIDEQIAQ